MLGIPVEDGVLEVEFSPLREEVIELPDGVTLINDCYNANPRLDAGGARAPRRRSRATAGKVAVLGEMAELGERGGRLPPRDRRRRSAGRASRRLVAVGPLAARVRSCRAHGVEAAQRRDAAEDAADALASSLRPGDVVLVKGSRSVGLEAVAAKLRA